MRTCELKFLRAGIIPQRAPHPEVMDRCAYTHYPVPCPKPCKPACTLDDVKPLDAHYGMFDDYPPLPHVLVVPPLHHAQFPVVRFPERHHNVDTYGAVPLEAAVLPQPGVQRILAVLHVGNLFVMDRPKVCAAQKGDILAVQAIDLVLVGVVFFFLAVHGLLGFVVNGPRHGLFHDVVADHARIAEALEGKRAGRCPPGRGRSPASPAYPPAKGTTVWPKGSPLPVRGRRLPPGTAAGGAV